MHGLGGEKWKRSRHMWPVPNSTATTVEAQSDFKSLDFFCKEGRKIQVGDCALFKPPKESPPFIGIIRSLTLDAEDTLSLGVNWLYRPADISLPKGLPSLEAAPNEVFYSFHKDEILAASLLHPCKVAFLCKGIELPPGISSFVCRRVYDIDNKCLWWLTDKDYINERQEEVDQLLNKTRLEMHGAVQSGGRSPKPLNGPSSTPQLKSGSDSASSFSSQVKGKKRERGGADLGSDSIKRERLSKTEDGDSGQFRPDFTLKSEIAKITDKGGLVDASGVEKLVQLMQPDTAEKKLDLAGRIMLVDVISGTERNECLGRFVQLRGLPVLDEWLQEVHKGKIGDGFSPKESDRSVEEFLLALLRALDRLPVNLHALQTCNVGKSVNYLRSHKNSEIQKKARSLVDMWKKRVEAEMNMNDAKSGPSRGVSWQNKPVPSESGSRKLGNSADLGPKSAASQQSVFKTQQVKLAPGDIASKSPTSVKPMNASGNSLKDQNFRMLVGAASSDLPLTPIKEEKSSSSSQSQNNSQSSEHAKTVGLSYKEDARSSTAGSVTGNKISGSASRQRKSSNGLQGSIVPGPQKEMGSVKVGSATRNLASEKSYQEKNSDATTLSDQGNSRLIVRFPNTGRSPARGSTGVSFEVSVSGCGKASPPREKHDNHHDKRPKPRNDPVRSSALSDGGFEDGVERPRLGEGGDERPLSEAPKVSGSLLKIMSRPTGKSYDAASFSSINALVESCAKISRASASASPGDDVGMNLLASVAAGEITKSDNGSGSPERNPSTPEVSNSGNDGKFRQPCEDVVQAQLHHRVSDLGNAAGNSSEAKVDSRHPNGAVERRDESGDSKTPSPPLDGERIAECSGQNANSSPLRDEKPPEQRDSSAARDEACAEAEEACKFHEPKKFGSHRSRSVVVSDLKLESDEDKKSVCADELVAMSEAVSASAIVEKSTCSSSEIGDKDSSKEARTDQKPSVNRSETKIEDSLPGPCSGNALDMAVNDGENADNVEGGLAEKTDSHAKDSGTCSSSSSDRDKDSGIKGHSDLKDSLNPSSVAPAPSLESPAPILSRQEESKNPKTDCLESNETKDRKPETAVRLDFDLNEGFSLDESSQVDHVKAGEPSGNSPAAIRLPCPLPFQSSPVSTGFPASITVAAPAKGGFYPPENPLRSKASLGWKGSAATSAFRPAEPRKSSEAITDSVPAKPARPPLDFDLNVADGEEEFSSGGGGLDLDLNRLDDNHHQDPGSFSVFTNSKLEITAFPGIRPNGAANNTSRDFDLNDGPSLDESAAAEAPPRVHQIKTSVPVVVPPQQQVGPIPGMRLSNNNMNNNNSAEYGNFSSWFPPANSYSAITVPPIFTARGEHSFVSSSPAGSQRVSAAAFGHEIYRGGPVLSSSPAVAFPPSAQIPYPGFPFETGFPLSSNSFSGAPAGYMDSPSGGAPICFPAIHSPLMGPGGIVSSAYPRPYVMNHLPGGASHVGPDGRKWGSQGLDLNAGPGVVTGDERLRQLPVTSAQALMEDQLKIFQIGGGGVMKRKEPDSGIDSVDRISYKQQHTWQ